MHAAILLIKDASYVEDPNVNVKMKDVYLARIKDQRVDEYVSFHTSYNCLLCPSCGHSCIFPLAVPFIPEHILHGIFYRTDIVLSL